MNKQDSNSTDRFGSNDSIYDFEIKNAWDFIYPLVN